MSVTRYVGKRRAFAPLVVAAMIAALIPVLGVAASTPAQAVTGNQLKIQVVTGRAIGSLKSGDDIDPAATYTWLITSDDVGDPTQDIAACQATNPGYPESCKWPSIRQTPGAVPVIAQGDQSTLNATTALQGLDKGKYLISVLADGYTLGGAHFTIPLSSPVLDVPVQPNPVPLGTMRIRVFHDNSPVDGTYEAGSETGQQGNSSNNLSGFEAHLSDVLGEVTTDWYGNPLCTNYVLQGKKVKIVDGSPVVNTANPGGHCLSNSVGDIVVPYLGSNRYGVTLSKPANKASWVQTTTLEGAHDHDVWVINGDNGLDSELVVGGEPVPWVQFGFVEQRTLRSGSNAATAHVTGQILEGLAYVGGNGGVTIPGGTGTAGGKEGRVIDRPWISLSDLGNGDQMVYTGRGDTAGRFDIRNVPDGTYQLTAWDDNQDYILFSFNVTVDNQQSVDTGKNFLSGWMSHFYGTVFVDTNENGIRDAGEQGIPGTAVTLRERDNSLMDQFTNTVTTDSKGNYTINEAYPLTRWLILEHFNTRYYGTGVTVQGENDPTPTTFRGAAVDINVLPVLGLGGRIDWGVKPYAPGTNGGIVGTVSYDTTRNELDPAYAVAEPYQPGVPGIGVNLFGVQKDTRLTVVDPADANATIPNPDFGMPILDSRGLPVRGPQLATTVTSETWAAPKGCTARQWDGTPLTGLGFIPQGGLAADKTCVESPAMGVQVRPADTTQDAWGQTVNGNYGFAESDLNLYLPSDPDNPGYPAGYAAAHPTTCPQTPVPTCQPGNNDLPLYAVLADYGYDPQALLADDYVVAVDIPDNPVGGGKMYQVTREQDVNVFDGDSYLPAENFPVTSNPSTTGSGSGGGPLDPPTAPPSQGGGLGISPCVGADQQVDVTNQNFLDNGGSPFQGQFRPLCDEKLVTLRGQSAVAPTFTMFTQTPLPTHFWGLTINDLGLTWDTRSIQYGEAQGIPNVPMGIYDFSGRLIDSVSTDFNGFYEAIEPSTSSYNCPTPAGPCAGMYRFVGNDPGQPGAPNANYNPRFRTIATNFQAYPGLFTVTDTAPTQTGAVAVTPGTTTPVPVNCDVSATTPELFAVDKVMVRATDSALARTVKVSGKGFGAQNGTSRVDVLLQDGTAVQATVSSWTSTEIKFVVPNTRGLTPVQGPLQLRIRNGAGITTTNAITIHETRTTFLNTYNPTVRAVPSAAYPTIQSALSAQPTLTAAQQLQDLLVGGTIVVVQPGTPSAFNPEGAWLENIVMNQKMKLQGFGPGGIQPDGTQVRGTVISGAAYDADGVSGTAWAALAARRHAGPAGVPSGAVVTVLPTLSGQFAASLPTGFASIDGFKITGGYQSDLGVAPNVVTGGVKTGYGAPGATVTQGGGVYVHAWATNLSVSNNVIIGNSGSYAGGVRVGTPYAAASDNQNDNVRIAFNRIRDNGGSNLAGGVGIFTGAQNYVVDRNDICGNFSQEYGGGISQYGFSPGGKITGNRLWFNESYDEGAGVFLAGELPANPDAASEGTGEQTISGNTIVANTANDDGGGIRLLQIGNYPASGAGRRPAAQRIGYLIRVENNVVADNVSTHEGGGIALDDAANVQIVSNTIARNVTSATAVTSDGRPAPAGLSTAANSLQLQATLPASASTWSKPALLGNIFWQNAAGTWTGTTITGIGVGGTADYDYWDMGSTDGSGPLAPIRGVVTNLHAGMTVDATNVLSPFDTVNFVSPYRVSVQVSTLRTFPGFRQSVIVVQNVAPDVQGSYRLNANSTAIDIGRGQAVIGGVTVDAPRTDIDGTTRYSGTPTTNTKIDAGADER
jgi:hypothetical protein